MLWTWNFKNANDIQELVAELVGHGKLQMTCTSPDGYSDCKSHQMKECQPNVIGNTEGCAYKCIGNAARLQYWKMERCTC